MNWKDKYIALRKKIPRFCLRCCGGSSLGVIGCHDTNCPWHEERMAPVQIELFDANYRDMWIASTVMAIDHLHLPLYWSDIRHAVCNAGVKGPGHPNWWGSVASRLLKTGRYTIDRNAGRTNPGHGSRENLWRRK